MKAKEILKAHILKTATLTDEQFEHFFSHFKYQHFQKGQALKRLSNYRLPGLLLITGYSFQSGATEFFNVFGAVIGLCMRAKRH